MTAENIDTLRSNIGDAIMRMKKEGTTGASVECLKQCTSSRGLTCPAHEFHAEFETWAKDVAKTLKFKVYK
mgnify:CR=1 FL=1